MARAGHCGRRRVPHSCKPGRCWCAAQRRLHRTARSGQRPSKRSRAPCHRLEGDAGQVRCGSAMTSLPVSRWPVKETIAVSSESTSARPVSAPPVTTLSTPAAARDAGRPAGRTRACSERVISLGLTTTVLPVSNAGAILRQSTASGKFQGRWRPPRRAAPAADAQPRLVRHPGGFPLRAFGPTRRCIAGTLRQTPVLRRLFKRLADLLHERLSQRVRVLRDQVGKVAKMAATRNGTSPVPSGLRL